MRVYKFLTTTTIITAAALMYVSQQTALIRLSYDIKERERSYSELLDRGKILLYNVKQLESPARLEKVLLAKNMKFEVPSKEQVIFASASLLPGSSKEVKKPIGVFGKLRQAVASIFVLGPEAEAKPIK